MRPEDLIAAALRFLLLDGSKWVRQAYLRRAISTAYLALFYAICYVVADLWIGANASARHSDAWRQAFRTLEHGKARKAFINQEKLRLISAELRIFAILFLEMQDKRHLADYDPFFRLDFIDVVRTINQCSKSIRALMRSSMAEKKIFVAILFLPAIKD